MIIASLKVRIFHVHKYIALRTIFNPEELTEREISVTDTNFTRLPQYVVYLQKSALLIFHKFRPAFVDVLQLTESDPDDNLNKNIWSKSALARGKAACPNVCRECLQGHAAYQGTLHFNHFRLRGVMTSTSIFG